MSFAPKLEDMGHGDDRPARPAGSKGHLHPVMSVVLRHVCIHYLARVSCSAVVGARVQQSSWKAPLFNEDTSELRAPSARSMT